MTDAYTDLRAAGVAMRRAASLTGLSRATQFRRTKTGAVHSVPRPRAVPANKLTDAERARVLAVLNSPEFVDCAPLTVWATLLDEGTYLCSVSTMYRILAENTLVKERRRLARHPKSTCPELVATAPRQVYS
ncbi:hypothetical protein NS506_02244 [Nocardia seriolae]|uniref:Transposase n=1 Tax=Nocardia seriolae TaxID=37332 RepID=A0ABC8AQA2_9NOCA|nr:hypothetical protein NS506_02244 [Nocardia seriolae]PSK27230.1 hypothetical protein C6575_32990 [Nocardia seriolae]QOW33131.1 hypothetical protein IMZ23_35705 [Nocardia seriolae]QUN14622.1 hypothetical protein KEC46_19130 [Nocardia seriolae]